MIQPDMVPNWRISEWLNTPEPIDLEAQRGRVVAACVDRYSVTFLIFNSAPRWQA